MPTDVEIRIIGLCLCFLKESPPVSPRDRIWNIVFSCDDRHELFFSFPEPDGTGTKPSSPQPLHIRGLDMFIDFESTDSNPQPAEYDRTFGDLLNLADEDLHGVAANGRHSNLKVHRKSSSRQTDQVWMRVPRATLSVSTPNEAKNCWLAEIDSSDLPTGNLICKPPKAEEVVLRFRFEGTLRVKACIGSNRCPFDQTFSGTSLQFAFDNKCQINTGINDSMDFYESVMDGAVEPGKRFVSGKFPVPCSILNDEDERKRSLDMLLREIMTPEANCDPVSSEPPPGP